MARLQELLGQSVTQSLGLSDLLARREKEATQSAQVREGSKGALAAAKIRGDARRKKGLFETVGTIVGAVGGAIVGGPAGASLGAQIGGGVGGAASGKRADTSGGLAQSLQQGVGAFAQLDAMGKAAKTKGAQSAADLAKTKAQTGKIEAETKRLMLPKGIVGDLAKKVLDVQASGKGRLASELKPDELKNLPKNAFFNLGSGENKISFVKAPKQLTPESAAKLAGAQQGGLGINKLLKGIKAGEITETDLRLASTGNIKRFTPAAQKVASAIDFNKEVLARIFSGAAVPETEQGRFQEIFSIKPFDTMEVIEAKMQRNLDMIDKIQKSVLYGASFENGILDSTTADALIKDAINESASPKSGSVLKFDSQGRRIQ